MEVYYYENNERVPLPLSITPHPATTGEWHVKNFPDDLQYKMKHSEIWI